MRSYKAYKEEVFNSNPEVKAEYDALQPEFDIIQAMIAARITQNLTQQDLSQKRWYCDGCSHTANTIAEEVASFR